MPQLADEPSKAQERTVVVLSLAFIAPVLAVCVVGGYGFAVWMLQMLAGPPGS